MTDDIHVKLTLLEEKIEQLQETTEKVRKYILLGFIAQLALVLVPLLALMIALPFLLSGIAGAYEGLL